MIVQFLVDFDGILDLQPGDTVELKIWKQFASDSFYIAQMIRQEGAPRVSSEPPPLGVSVSDALNLDDRLT